MGQTEKNSGGTLPTDPWRRLPYGALEAPSRQTFGGAFPTPGGALLSSGGTLPISGGAIPTSGGALPTS